MTVLELINTLQQFPPEVDVFVVVEDYGIGVEAPEPVMGYVNPQMDRCEEREEGARPALLLG